MMSYQFRRLMKTQAEILKEVRAQTVLLREIRDKDVKEPMHIISESEAETWLNNFPETYRAYWVGQAPKPSCMDRLKRWWRNRGS